MDNKTLEELINNSFDSFADTEARQVGPSDPTSVQSRLNDDIQLKLGQIRTRLPRA